MHSVFTRTDLFLRHHHHKNVIDILWCHFRRLETVRVKMCAHDTTLRSGCVSEFEFHKLGAFSKEPAFWPRGQKLSSTCLRTTATSLAARKGASFSRGISPLWAGSVASVTHKCVHHVYSNLGSRVYERTRRTDRGKGGQCYTQSFVCPCISMRFGSGACNLVPPSLRPFYTQPCMRFRLSMHLNAQTQTRNADTPSVHSSKRVTMSASDSTPCASRRHLPVFQRDSFSSSLSCTA